jgi:cell wall-associated NlpC family hydrolase
MRANAARHKPVAPVNALSCVLLLATLVGCSVLPRPPSEGLTPPVAKQAPLSSKRQDVVMHAMAMLDRNYVYSGKKLHTGFDCSGLVSFVYKESAGLELRGSASDIANKTRPIAAESAAPGDLVFFDTLGSPSSHVGIYIGSGKFIHAANERTGVRIDQITADYWAKRLEGYRSVL